MVGAVVSRKNLSPSTSSKYPGGSVQFPMVIPSSGTHSSMSETEPAVLSTPVVLTLVTWRIVKLYWSMMSKVVIDGPFVMLMLIGSFVSGVSLRLDWLWGLRTTSGVVGSSGVLARVCFLGLAGSWWFRGCRVGLNTGRRMRTARSVRAIMKVLGLLKSFNGLIFLLRYDRGWGAGGYKFRWGFPIFVWSPGRGFQPCLGPLNPRPSPYQGDAFYWPMPSTRLSHRGRRGRGSGLTRYMDC